MLNPSHKKECGRRFITTEREAVCTNPARCNRLHSKDAKYDAPSLHRVQVTMNGDHFKGEQIVQDQTFHLF